MRRRVKAMALVGALALGAGSLSGPAMADVLEVSRDTVLRGMTREEIAQRRSKCVTGSMASSTKQLRAAGFRTLSTGAYCVTVLTRAGRDRTLGYIELTKGQTTSASSFDAGFVSGYLRRGAVPADAPSMATLLPVADRCLSNMEPNVRICHSVGTVLGARAAQGELVPVS